MNIKTNSVTRRHALTIGGAVLASSLISPSRSIAATAGKATDAKITQVRNATLIVEYGGALFLVDPMLSEKGAFPGFPGSAHSQLRNPLVELPMPIDKIIDVDAVIVTHLHPDHWDEAAKSRLPKSLPIYAQNEADAILIRRDGFSDVRVLSDSSEFNGVKLTKTEGQHGSDETLAVAGEILGKVCGVVFRHPNEKTIYLAGDTVWNRFVESSIARYKPDVIILNTGNAVVLGLDPIIMGREDVLAVHKAAPAATIIATHMEAINHCILSRADLKDFAEKQGFAGSLLIPADGEVLSV